MVKLEIVADFVKQISKALGIPEGKVEDYFEVDEDEQGWFYAKKHAKKWLETSEFKAMCALARDLGGDYVKHEQTWKVPSEYVKKQQAENQVPQAPSQAQLSGVTPYSVSMDKSKPPELESSEVEPSDEYFIAKSVAQVGYLYPVLKDIHGNVIDGYHRLNIDSNWPIKKVEEVTDPVQLAIARLIANVCRRDISSEEKTEWLKQIATLTGWTPKQIAANLPVSYTWVMKYLPDEYKTKAWEQEKPITRRVIEKQFVPCARCGVATSSPVHLSGHFYCANCAERVVAEAHARRAVQPEIEHELTTGFPPLPSEPATAGPPELKPVEVPEPKPEPLLTGFEVECPECHKKILINHKEYPNGKIIHEVED